MRAVDNSGSSRKVTMSRQHAKALRREAIMESAKVLFAKHGFLAVSIDDIGGGAGVSGPAVYKHFSSKEAILSELLVGISNYLKAGGGHIVENWKATSSQEILVRLIDFHLAFAVSEPELIRIHDRDLGSLPYDARERVRALQRAYVQRWVGVLTAMSDLTRDQATVRVHAVFGMLNSTPYVVRRKPEDVIRSQLRRAALAALEIPVPE